MGNKIKISSMGLLYHIVIVFGLSVASYADDVDYVYNQWIKNAYKYNEPILSEIKGQNIESYRFVFDSGEWGLRTVVRITKYDNKYMLNGIKVGNDDYGYDGKGTLIEIVLSEEEWNMLSDYIQDLSYESMSPQHDNYRIFDASYIILEGIKNGKYYYVGRYSPNTATEERKLEKFEKAVYGFKRYFYKIYKDKTRERVVIDLDAKYKKNKAEEELRKKQQEEERAKLYAQRVMKERQKKLWTAVEKGGIYPLDTFKDLDANIKNDEGKTPLMIATQNGYSDLIRSLSDAKVNVSMKDNEGKTAFDYIGISTGRMQALSRKRVYGALRVLEVAQLVKGYAKIMSYSYENDIDFLNIVIKGETCYRFKFPKNTKCSAMPKQKRTSHKIFQAIQSKDNELFDTLLKEVDLNITNRHDYSLLWAGIHYENLYAVDKVLKKDMDINQLDKNKLHKPISWAITQNDVPLLQVLLDNGVDVNSKGKFGNPILFKAMYKCRSFETISLLLDNGANPYLKSKRGKTVFDIEPVFCKDKSQIVKMKQLLKKGSKYGSQKKATQLNKKLKIEYKQKEKLEKKHRAHKKLDRYISTLSDINVKDKQGYTSLHKAVSIKHYATMIKLLKQGAEMYALDGQYGVWTPFNYAVAINDPKAIKIFLDNGADINFYHKKGSTLLHDAIRKCDAKMVKFLLDNGANPRLKDGHGDTVMAALKKCDNQTQKETKALIENAIVNGKNRTLLKVEKPEFEIDKKRSKLEVKRKKTIAYKKTIKEVKNPIFTAIAFKKNNDFDKYLNNIDTIELTSSDRKTLLYVAVEEHNYYAIDKLLQKGADMNAMKEYQTYTPFTYAAARNDLKAVQMFLDKGADANYQYKKSLTILAVAVKQCNMKMITLLLDHGANPKLEDKRGDSAVASLGHCNKKNNKEIGYLINNSKRKTHVKQATHEKLIRTIRN